jgi:hypothetical protein
MSERTSDSENADRNGDEPKPGSGASSAEQAVEREREMEESGEENPS